MQGKKQNSKPLLIVGVASLYLVIFLCACALLLGVLLRACSSVQTPNETQTTEQTTAETDQDSEMPSTEQTTQIPVPVPPDDWYGYAYGLETVLADSYLQTISFTIDSFCQSPEVSGTVFMDAIVQDGKILMKGYLYEDIAHEIELLAQFSDDFLRFYASSPNVLSIIQRIQRTRACSVLRNNDAEDAWQQIAVYRIENRYYFVFFDQSGMVERIHAAEIRYTKVDEMYESGLSKNLISRIGTYMFEQTASIYPAPTSFAIKLYQIDEYELQPLLINFNADDYYYACAYYTPTHEYPESESHHFCCADQYIWVRYDSPEQIAEQHDGMNLVCAFQINQTLYCKDIGHEGGLSKDLSYFHRYTPVFENGFNVAPCIEFDQTFIYLNDSNLETAYHSTELFNHMHKSFECVELDGQLYVPLYLYTEKADGTKSNTADLAQELDSYYDRVMSVMVTGRYSVYNDKNGSIKYYGLIPLEDIQDMILE